MKKEKAQLKQKVKVTIFLAAMQPKESLMAGAKLTKFLALTSLKVDIISLGTYLKRFNFRTHSKQVNIRDNLVKH